MEDVQIWLQSRVDDVLERNADNSVIDFAEEAKRIWSAGIDAGYSNAEIQDACAGDMELYLLKVHGHALDARLKAAETGDHKV
jgi:hypothetical protein